MTLELNGFKKKMKIRIRMFEWTRGERPLDRVREVYGFYLGTKSCAYDKDCFGPSDHVYYTVIK